MTELEKELLGALEALFEDWEGQFDTWTKEAREELEPLRNRCRAALNKTSEEKPEPPEELLVQMSEEHHGNT